jgi:hypothetical protein
MLEGEVIKYFIKRVFDEEVDGVEIDLFELSESGGYFFSDIVEYVFEPFHWFGSVNKYLQLTKFFFYFL